MYDVRLASVRDWEAIKEIYEEGIRTGNATFQTEAPSEEQWFESHVPGCTLVCESGQTVVGWVALSRISSRPVYAGVAEVSVYVKQALKGTGIGGSLMDELIRRSEEQGFWTLQSGIFPENMASVKLHLKHGFREVGRREKLGAMGGVWRDVLLFERRSRLIGQ